MISKDDIVLNKEICTLIRSLERSRSVTRRFPFKSSTRLQDHRRAAKFCMKLAPNPEHYRVEWDGKGAKKAASGLQASAAAKRARTSSPLATRLNYKSGQTQWSNGGNNSRPAAGTSEWVRLRAAAAMQPAGRAGGRAERAAYQQPASGRFNLPVRSLAHSLSCSRAACALNIIWMANGAALLIIRHGIVAIIIIIQLVGCTLCGLSPESRWCPLKFIISRLSDTLICTLDGD